MPRIDAHHHVWDLTRVDLPWIQPDSVIARNFSIDEFSATAAGAGIDGALVVQSVPSAGETHELLALAATHAFLAGVVGWTDLTAAHTGDLIEQLQDCPGGRRLVAIRHLVQEETDRNWFDRPDVRTGIAAVGAAGLVYDLLVLPDQLDATIRLVRDLPDVTFVLDHLAKPPYLGDLAPWAAGIRALSASDNVSCKVSGMVTELEWASCSAADLQPAVDVVRDAFGPERLLFGSDWPLCLTQTTYADVVSVAETLLSGSTPAELDAFFGGNATRIYRLDGRTS